MPRNNQRKVDKLLRVTGYVSLEEYAWLISRAASEGWTISRYLAHVLIEAHEREQRAMWEATEDFMVGIGEL